MSDESPDKIRKWIRDIFESVKKDLESARESKPKQDPEPEVELEFEIPDFDPKDFDLEIIDEKDAMMFMMSIVLHMNEALLKRCEEFLEILRESYLHIGHAITCDTHLGLPCDCSINEIYKKIEKIFAEIEENNQITGNTPNN